VDASEPLAIDGTIQRFELTFELFWKTVRRLLARQGVEANSPKAVLQQAYRLRWLDDEQAWLALLKDRNLTSHTNRLRWRSTAASRLIMRPCAGLSTGYASSRQADAHSIARTISSVIFLASPNSIMVLSL
jgi:hypothetical protein